MKIGIVVVVTCLTICATSVALGQPRREKGRSDTVVSTSLFPLLSHTTTPQLEERKRQLRMLQQNGYARILTEVIRNDGLMALMVYLKTRLQIEYSISHEPVYVDIAARPETPQDSLFVRRRPSMMRFFSKPIAPAMFGLNIDYRFPEDPWRRE
jgi:hypothetical protein